MEEIKLKSADELMDECELLLSDKKTAQKGYKKVEVLANNGVDWAICFQALALMRGTGVAKDEKKAFELLKKHEGVHYPELQRLLGSFYELGIGTEVDCREAYICYKRATLDDHVQAYVDLARMYMNGKYVDEDNKKAFALNMYAANMGSANGMYNVGMMYKVGLGVKQNFSSAVEWLKKASDAGHEDASVELGDYYLDRDEEQAVFYYGQGAEKGNAHAKYVLYQFYRDGLGGLEQNDAKAFELCSQAAALGDKDAIGDMGCCYEDGVGVDQDYGKALEWYLKAGEAGNALGFLNAGYAYSNGRGAELNYDLALENFKKASEMGEANGITAIGWLYREGASVKKNLQKAFQYLCTAACLGDAEAMNSVGNAYKNGQAVDVDYKLAYGFYQKAADAGDTNAMGNVCNCYVEGKGVERDLDKALSWYDKAKESGCSDKKLAECREKLKAVGIDVLDNEEE